MDRVKILLDQNKWVRNGDWKASDI